jgi:4-amino-4-deoxy-L-arabinose transferase-like glycosyltransferase
VLKVTQQAGEGVRALGWVPWVLLALTWLATLQVRPLLDPDEGRYAEIPREMALSGDWVTPRLDGLKYFEKPPLQYWVTAAVYRVLGYSEGTSRLWTVGLAFLCLPLVYGWTARLYGQRAGLAALAALGVSPLFLIVGHLGLLDAGFTFWLTATVFAFTLGQSSRPGSARERQWMLAAWAAAALAVLTKGIVVAVLAGGSLVAYTLIERDLQPWRRLHALPGVALLLAVVAPWFVLVSRANVGFLEFFFVHEHFTRYLTTEQHRAGPWYYFLPLLLLGVLPWGGSLARAVRRVWLNQDEIKTGPTPQFKPLRFLLIFALITLLFFSASGSKLPPYILPMLPPLAAIVGAHSAEPGFFRRLARLGGGLVTLAGIGVLIYCARKNSYLPQETLIWAGVAIVASLVAVVVTWRKERDVVAQALVTAAAGTLAWQALLCEYAATPPARSARNLVAAVKPYVHPGTTLFTVGQYRETISPYLQRTLIVVGFRGDLTFGLGAEPTKQQVKEEEFPVLWRSMTDAVGFFEPELWARYRSEGLPGRVVAADGRTVAVSRS